MAFQGTCKSLLIGTKFQAKALHIVGHKKDFGSNIGTLVSDVQTGVTKKHQKIIFEYWVFSQKSYLNMGRFEKNIFAYQKFDFCIPKILYLHTK